MNDGSAHLKLSHVDLLDGGIPEAVRGMTMAGLSLDTGKYPVGSLAFARIDVRSGS